jgi:hypothetical protein
MKALILAAAALGLSVSAASANCGAAHEDVVRVDKTTVASVAADKKPASTTATATEGKKATEKAD